MAILGIDTGRNGGMAELDGRGALQHVWRTPSTRDGIDWARIAEIFGLFKTITASMGAQPEVAIERVLAFAGMAHTGTLLANYGRYLMLIEQAGLSYSEYTPTQWQASFRPRKARKPGLGKMIYGSPQAALVEANRANKLASQAMAESIWPYALRKFGKDWTDGTAEAALIGQHHFRAKLVQQQQQALEKRE